MKYLIAESKLGNIIFKYLDSQDFIQIEYGKNIYLVNSEGDEYAQVRYNTIADWCTIDIELIKELSKFFSMEYSPIISIVDKWVENKLGVESVMADVQKDIIIYYF